MRRTPRPLSDVVEERRLRREQEDRDIEACKAKLAKEHGLERNAKFEQAWKLAWDLGHPEGFAEIELYFDDLAELIRP